MKKIRCIKKDGWTCVQEADPEKHILEISCFAKDGMITETRIRHSRGEEVPGRVTLNGENALPLSTADFRKLYNEGALEIK